MKRSCCQSFSKIFIFFEKLRERERNGVLHPLNKTRIMRRLYNRSFRITFILGFCLSIWFFVSYKLFKNSPYYKISESQFDPSISKVLSSLNSWNLRTQQDLWNIHRPTNRSQETTKLISRANLYRNVVFDKINDIPEGREDGILFPDLLQRNEQVFVKNETGSYFIEKYGNYSDLCTDLHSDIQDLFCMTKLPYLEDVKNPCWYELGCSGKLNCDQRLRLRCLPYYHILGCAKCATTDIYNRLIQHPRIFSNNGMLNKEALWWSWSKYGITNWKINKVKTFEEYTSIFDNTAEHIETLIQDGSKLVHKIITGDASPPDFWDFRAWPLIAQNKGPEPTILTPHLMKHIYRKPKFILILRNPTDRLYSDYYFSGYGDNPYSFHEDIINSIWTIETCLTNHTVQHCFYSAEIFAKLKSRIHFGCYVVYLMEWLKIFDRDQFYIVRTEDYADDVDKYIAEMFTFLEVDPLSDSKLHKIEMKKKQRITKSKQKADPMLPKTRRILDKFYEEYNKDLSQVLKDKKYLWSDVNTINKLKLINLNILNPKE
ncbi:carbohydrate sulfotransferase 15 [Patella vulgata]|uniref:carbohydrate sulfotransferase 15 n=1 Tax=Patella vulgata TaxID=6465 RepID=UPI00217F50E8|nr:carbohydrate sulfotransferase 15 [Patella vulgata]